MADYLKCPLCMEFYNLKNKIPVKNQCGGVCCSSCTRNPCSLCEEFHNQLFQNYDWLIDYIREVMILCKCGENTAVFIDGKTFIPNCSSCKKPYQQGVKIDENLFTTWINSIFSHFLEQLNKSGNEGLLGYFFENTSKSLELKLKCIRTAHQFFTSQAYCEDHLEKKAKFLGNDLKLLCDCGSDFTPLSDIERCRETVKNFVGATGLLNQFLIDQLYVEKQFATVKVVFEARCMKRKAKITDVCPFCKVRFSQIFPVIVECKNHYSKMLLVICDLCSWKKKQTLQEMNINKKLFPCLENDLCSFRKIESVNLEYSNSCSNCSKIFRIDYITPLEKQVLTPFKLQCEHNICKTCADKSCNNLIFCNICKQFYKFYYQINHILLEAFNARVIGCPHHSEFFIETYYYENGYNFYCEKCKNDRKNEDFPQTFHISWIWMTVTNNYHNILEYFKMNCFLNVFELGKLRNVTIKKEIFEQISKICMNLQWEAGGNVEVVSNEVLSLTSCQFSLKSSRSIVITGLYMTVASIEGKLKVYMLRDGIFQCIFFMFLEETLETSFYNLKCHGSLFISQGNIYKFEIIECDGFDGLKLKTSCTSSDNSVQFDIEFRNIEEDRAFSLIKSFDYEIPKY